MSLRIRMDQFVVPLRAKRDDEFTWLIGTADRRNDGFIGTLTQLTEQKWTYTFRGNELRKRFFFSSRLQALQSFAKDELAYRNRFQSAAIKAPVTQTVPRLIKKPRPREYTPTGWPLGTLSQKRYRGLMTDEQRIALIERQRRRRA